MMWWDDEDGDHGDERDWTQPEAWAPEDGGRPFRGTDPKGLPDDKLLRGFRAVKTALARQRRRVEDLEQRLPKLEAEGEPGQERLDAARSELERLKAVRRNWRGPAREAKERRERERRIEGAREAREGLEGKVEHFLDARLRERRARESLGSALARLGRLLRDPDVAAEVEPLSPDLAARLRRVAAQEDAVGAGVDLDRIPVEGEEREEEARQVVERPDEVVLVGEWSEEERRAKSTEHGGKPARVVSRAEVTR